MASVVINDLHVERVPVLPLKADTPLLIDPNAVLLQLFPRPLLDLPIEALHELTQKHRPGIFVLEASDHSGILTLYVINAKR